jgi:glyoxylase-like metal-dependent hydrolase (beta-lactamase superfamily II)
LRDNVTVIPLLPTHGINVFAICEDEDNGKWWLVDAGFPGSFIIIRDAIARIFGRDARPEAILITHGHADHVGAARDLAVYFDVNVYAHASELPFLNGTLDYPPADASVGGPMGLIAPFLSTKGVDLGEAIRDIANAPLPTGWEIVETGTRRGILVSGTRRQRHYSQVTPV